MRRPYPLLFAACVPPLFVHAEFQPSISATVGGSEATLYLADAAVLAIGVIGLVAGLSEGFRPLRAGSAVWLSSGVFLAMVAAGTAVGAVRIDGYPIADNLLTAAKLAEYALLALAAPLVFRREEDCLPLFVAITATSVAATTGAVLQFLGVVDQMGDRKPGERQPSFLGFHDFAALSGAALALFLVALALRRVRPLSAVAGVVGGLGTMLAGATAAVAGVCAAAAAAWARGRRRAAALAAIAVTVATGAVAIRTVDTSPLLDLLSVERATEIPTDPEASWEQRIALAYIGGRIFLAHPLVGVGWHGSSEVESFSPYLDDTRRKFPDLPERALPSNAHPWGVQNAYVQAAADLGIAGLAAFLALFLVPLRVAWRAGIPGAVPILWLLVAMGVWIGIGLVAGIPLVGLTWLAIGLAAAAAAWR